MKRIEVGMLVRVVAAVNPRMQWTIGKVAKVLRQDHSFTHADVWDLEGLERNHDGMLMGFASESLEPINPDNHAGTWEEVQKITKWNPSKVLHGNETPTNA